MALTLALALFVGHYSQALKGSNTQLLETGRDEQSYGRIWILTFSKAQYTCDA